MILAVALGGATGACLRGLLDQSWAHGWPWSTLTINLVGSLLLGVLTVLASRPAFPGWVRPALGTGLLGGFTTFSAYAVQVHLVSGGTRSPDLGGVAGGTAYLLLTPLLCVGAAGLAIRGTERALHTGLVADGPDRSSG